jgi:hypothetical protein
MRHSTQGNHVKSQLVTEPVRHEHPPQPLHPVPSRPVRRVGPLDRAALHLGIALIKWGRRRARVDLREELALNAETHAARREMERARDRQAASLPRIL